MVDTKIILGVGAIGIVGFFYYQSFYKPQQMLQEQQLHNPHNLNLTDYEVTTNKFFNDLRNVKEIDKTDVWKRKGQIYVKTKDTENWEWKRIVWPEWHKSLLFKEAV